MELNSSNSTSLINGFVAGVVITVLSVFVFVPPSADGTFAGATSTQGGGGDGAGAGDASGTDGGGGDGTGLFGSGSGGDSEASAEGDGGTSDGSSSDGSTSGGSTSGGTTTGGTTSGGSASGGTTSDGTTGDATTTGGTTDGGSTDGGTTDGGSTDGGSTDGGTTDGGSTDGGTTDGGSTDGGTTDGGSTDGGSGGELACRRDRNGGQTDTGVFRDKVKLGATVAESGAGASFLGQARTAMNAVVGKVNQAGGICGRLLDVQYVDDGWDASEGKRAIESLIDAEKVFALPVVPSSEGLNAASKAGVFERKKVPVVGSDGMIRTQYSDPYIFPVAASTVTMMHVMAKDAHERGAKNVGIVFEKTYRFGVEGAYAYNQAWKRLTGSDIPGYSDPFGNPTCGSGTQFCAIPAGQNSYSSEPSNFGDGCSDCDFVAYLLEPSAAQAWFSSNGADPASSYGLGSGAAAPLFTRDFGVNCGDKCNGLWLWTGYNPPLEQYADDPAVRQYVEDVRAVNQQADVANQFTEGAYLGMVTFVEAMANVGPNLTRTRLMDALHSMTVDIGLSPALSWDEGDHFANPAVQAFRINSKDGFKEWTHVRGYVNDPWLGEDMG